jgi:hypothetical protein
MELDRRIGAIEKCGKNQGPHQYIPVRWHHDVETNIEEVTHFMCMVCFTRVGIATLLKHGFEAKL